MSDHDDERSNERQEDSDTRDLPHEGVRPERPSGRVEHGVSDVVGDIGEEGERPKRPSGR